MRNVKSHAAGYPTVNPEEHGVEHQSSSFPHLLASEAQPEGADVVKASAVKDRRRLLPNRKSWPVLAWHDDLAAS